MLSALHDLNRLGIPNQKILSIVQLKGYQKLIDIGTNFKQLLVSSSNVKLELSDNEKINLAKNQLKKINSKDINDFTVLCLLISEKLLDSNEENDVLNNSLPSPIAIPYSCHIINNNKIPGLFLSTTLSNRELEEISNSSNKSVVPLEMLITFDDNDTLLAYDIEPVDAMNLNANLEGLNDSDSTNGAALQISNESIFKRGKHIPKPNGWEDVVRFHREHGLSKTIDEYPQYFDTDNPNISKLKLKRWSECLKRLETNQFSKRKSGGVPSYGYEIDNELANDCHERVAKGLSINLVWLRTRLIEILKKHDLENTVIEKGGRFAYKDSWAQRFYKRHNFPLNTRDKRKFDEINQTDSDSEDE